MYIYKISFRILNILIHSLLASSIAAKKSEDMLILDSLYMCQFFSLWRYIELSLCSLLFQNFTMMCTGGGLFSFTVLASDEVFKSENTSFSYWKFS